MTIQEINDWIQRRIDYWEDVCDKHKVPIHTLTELVYEEGKEQGEESGMLEGFYQVQEFIKGQRR